MKFVLAALATMVATASAHSTVYSYHLNGQDKGQLCTLNGAGKQQGGPSNSLANYRCPTNNDPVKNLAGSSMICNVNNAEAPKWDTVYPGDSITFEWHHDSPYASDDIIASSHKGGIAIYAAPAASNGAGAVWVKLWQDGVAPGNWAIDRLIAARGRHWFKVPALKPGKYLFRPELFTLHEADTAYSSNPARGIQLYPACLQFEVAGSGALTLPAGVTFPGAYSYSDPGIVYNLYNPPAGNYVIPGPAVWSGASVTGGYGLGPANTEAPPATTTRPPVTTTTRPPVTTTQAPGECNPVTVTETVQGDAQTVTVTVTQGGQQQTTANNGGGNCAARYGQCGGRGWSGPTCCTAGTCRASGEYYSQCV